MPHFQSIEKCTTFLGHPVQHYMFWEIIVKYLAFLHMKTKMKNFKTLYLYKLTN